MGWTIPIKIRRSTGNHGRQLERVARRATAQGSRRTEVTSYSFDGNDVDRAGLGVVRNW